MFVQSLSRFAIDVIYGPWTIKKINQPMEEQNNKNQ